jgi:hypothetical protein
VLKIISFINQFGIDSLNHVDQKCGINSLLVFVHTPDVLFQDVRDVVLKNSQGIGENRMRHIMWHLDGRERRNK